MLSAARVQAATREWVWIPDTASVVETEEYTLVRFPEWSDGDLVLLRFEPRPGEAGAVVEEVLGRSRATGAPALTWWVRLDDPPRIHDLVRSLGGVLDETVDVFALDLADGAPTLGEPGPDVVAVRWVDDVETLRWSHRVMADVFGGAVPPDDVLAAEAASATTTRRETGGGGVVALVDGEPAGTGGLTVAGDVGRLWSGAVREPFRGRGVYRTLLAARLAEAVERGCALALVKGVVTTSGPILRRAGFEVFGQERSYVVAL